MRSTRPITTRAGAPRPWPPTATSASACRRPPRSAWTACRRAEAAELAAALARGRARARRPVPRVGHGRHAGARPGALRDALDRGAIGLEVAADVLAAPGRCSIASLRCSTCSTPRERPLLVHPGPAGAATRPAGPAGGRRVVPYVTQLHAAWWAWADGGRDRFPRPAGLLRRAGRPRPAARRAPPRPRRRRAAPSTRSRSSRRRPTARRPSTPSSACSASTSSATAPTVPTPRRRRPAWGDAALHAIRTSNPGRLLAHFLEEVPHDADASQSSTPRPARAGSSARSCCALVEHVAAAPRAVGAAPGPDAGERTYAALHRDADVDVWAIFWLPENDTGWHDHDTSSGAVHVVEGALEEHALLLAQPERRTRYGAGGVVRVRPLAHPPADVRRAARGLDPRLLAAAVAAGPVHGRRRRRAAPHVGLLRRRAAAARARRALDRRLTA